MKNISYIINGVFAVAIIVLFVLFFTSNKGGSLNGDPSHVFSNGGDSVTKLPIAYVNVDSLVINYNYAKDQNEVLTKEYKNSNAILNQKQRQIEAEVADFQKKIQNNAFLSEERARQEQMRIQKLEADFHATAEKLQEGYGRKQMEITAQITDSVRSCLKNYNKAANYEIIFSNKDLDNVLLAKDGYDITKEIITILNNRYKPEAVK